MISLLPEHYLLAAVLVLICYGISFGLSSPMNFPFIYKNMSYLSILVLLNVLFLNLNDFVFSTISFNFFFLKDDFVVFIELFTLLATFNILLAVVKYNKEMHIYYFEYVLLILFMVLSIYFLISSNELISFYFILEFQGICLYVLAAFNRKQKSSLEAGIKYFILGSFSSIILLLGFSFIYCVSGLTHFEDLFIFFMTYNNNNVQSILIDISIVLVGTAFFFKIYAAPFHFWIADVYQGSPTSSMVFFATVPLISFFFILIKFYLNIFYNFMDTWKLFVLLTCLFSLVLGTLGALYQQYLKRLLAYSSISNVGFVISSFLFDNPFMYHHAFNYIVLYSINLLGILSLFLNLYIKNKRIFLENLSLLSGLFKQNKMISVFIVILLYSVAGLPPFSFFFGKIFLLTSLTNSSFTYLVYPIVATTLIGSFYYLRIVQFISYNSYSNWLFLTKVPYIVLFNVFLIICFNCMYLFNYSTINVLTYYVVLDLYL